MLNRLRLSLLAILLALPVHAIEEQEFTDEEMQHLMQIWKPLEVKGDAIPWSRFAETKEVEVCEKRDDMDWCMIKPEYSADIQTLDGKQVTLMGFMFPLDEAEKQKNFLIGPYPASCPFQYHVGPAQVVEVLAEEAVAFSYEPVTVTGTLRVRYNEETEVFYYLENATPK